jgi:photosystem II stability/assembly factor-like uncharacterized protein
MNETTFLAISNHGLNRAVPTGAGQWAVENILADRDPRCLAAVPGKPGLVYAGTQGHGVWQSSDMGKTWQPAGLDGHTVKSIAASPHDPGTIYAGTRPACVFVSRDGGGNWSELENFRHIRGRRFWRSPAEKPFTAYVQSLALSPSDPDRILAGIEFGAVIRSEDGGRTWSNHISGSLRDCHNLKFHATNGDWAYEAGGTGGGASASRDGGRTWRKVKAGLAKNYGVACAADPERPEVWYVSVAPGPGKAYGRVAQAYLYRASAGADWQPIGWEPHPMTSMPTALATDPAAPGHLYAGLTNGQIWHSADYGASWDRLPFQMDAVWYSLLILK